jgi:hypothetical protein
MRFSYPKNTEKDLRLSNLTIFDNMPSPIVEFISRVVDMGSRNTQVRVLLKKNRSEQYGRKSSNMGTYRI